MALLSEQIRLEKWVSAKNGNGDWIETVTKYNLFAEILSSSSFRANANGRQTLNQVVKFRVRFRPDFKPQGNWRIAYEAKRYTVTSIEKENGKRFYWIITGEVIGF